MKKDVFCRSVNEETWLRFCRLARSNGVNNGTLLSSILEKAFKDLPTVAVREAE